MFNIKQLKEFIIKPALYDLSIFDADIMDYLLGIVAYELAPGIHLKNDNLYGIYQLSREAYNYLWQVYLPTKKMLTLSLIHQFDVIKMPSEDRLIYDLRFATAMQAIHYLNIQDSLKA
jgi:hypothetical protein